jgi:hypothetical protein
LVITAANDVSTIEFTQDAQRTPQNRSVQLNSNPSLTIGNSEESEYKIDLLISRLSHSPDCILAIFNLIKTKYFKGKILSHGQMLSLSSLDAKF